MNDHSFEPRDFKTTLRLLCEAHGKTYFRAGTLNMSALARTAGTSQSNISRWLSGQTYPLDDNVAKLAKAFKISPAQMRGELPIERIDGITFNSEEDERFYQEFQSLPNWMKNSIREQVKHYKTRDNQDDPE